MKLNNIQMCEYMLTSKALNILVLPNTLPTVVFHLALCLRPLSACQNIKKSKHS